MTETLFAPASGEGEVGALVIGTYGFTRIVSEITVCPRPASPGSTITVETDRAAISMILVAMVALLHGWFCGCHGQQSEKPRHEGRGGGVDHRPRRAVEKRIRVDNGR
jgi:hypothetical protein